MIHRTLARITASVVVLIALLPLLTPGTAAQVTSLDGISSKRYIVIDADTGEVFVEHNADDEAAMASLTKIFTTIEALERGDLSERITTDSSDLFDSTSTTMGLAQTKPFPCRTFSMG